MTQQRIFKIFKEGGALNFSTLLYNYKVLDYNGNKKITSKVESPPTIIDEANFINRINGLSSTSEFLYAGTVWASIDNRSFIVTEPKGVKEVYIHELKNTFRYPHPNIAYYITKTATDKPYVAGIWFYLDDEITERTMFYAAWSLNVFRTGFICTHNIYEDNLPKDVDYNVLINTAIEDFWRGNFNGEVSDLTKNEVLRVPNIIKLKLFKNDTDFFYQQLEGLANNYDLNGPKFKETMATIGQCYYKCGNFAKIVYAIMRNNPQTQLTSDEETATLANNYVISDIVASAYSS